MKRSPLHEVHVKLGATFSETAGWEMPLHYGNPEAEYDAVRRAVGLADLADRGRLRVTGEDRIKWLQSIISNDILSLEPGQGRYACLLTHKGRVLTYFRVYRQRDAVILEDVGEIGETTFQALRKFLLYGTKAKLENCVDSWGLLLVSGPRASSVIRAAFGIDVSSVQPVSFITQEAAGHETLLLCTEETGEVDFAVLIPVERVYAVWHELWVAGQAMGLKPVGTAAREMLRVEAGLPKAGVDLNEDIVPPEANLEGKAFSLSKGCYPGQEVLARMDTYGHVRRRLVGLTLHDPIIPPRGAKLFSGTREVGWLSSAVRSPRLGQVIALGFTLRDFTTPGLELMVEVDSRRYTATVHALPFYTKG
jgi:glycine cleavage system T protein